MWVSDGVDRDDDRPIGIVLLADGTGKVRNWPIWNGTGTCTAESFTRYDGMVAWREENKVPVIGTPSGDVEILPALRFGQDWDKLVLNFCGSNSPHVVFFGGPIDEGVGVGALDALEGVDW